MLGRGSRSVRGRPHKYILERFVRRSFPLFEKLGFHISLNHFYEPIPDTRTLGDELWARQSSLIGIDLDEEAILTLLYKFVTAYRKEYDRFPKSRTEDPLEFYIRNDTFGSVDAEIYYCVIRHFKPRRILEIGCGNSTLLAALAVLENRRFGVNSRLIGIEPYPSEVMSKKFPGLSELRRCKAQDIGMDEFRKLKKNDILFIDSSHVLRIGSDIQYLFLEVLPRLRKGVLVHFHDIFLPVEYPKRWVLKERKFWNEQYFLHAFLISNESFRVIWPGSFMHLRYPEELENAFGSYNRESVWPGSFWIEKTV